MPPSLAPDRKRQANENEVGRQRVRGGKDAASDQDRHLTVEPVSALARQNRHRGNRDQGQRRDRVQLPWRRQQGAKVGQVDLAAAWSDRRSSWRQPVENPTRIQDRHRRPQRHARRRPARKHAPSPRQQERDAQRQHQLRFHESEAKREPGDVRPVPEGERGADAKRYEPVELSVEKQQRGGNGGEDRKYRRGRARPGGRYAPRARQARPNRIQAPPPRSVPGSANGRA